MDVLHFPAAVYDSWPSAAVIGDSHGENPLRGGCEGGWEMELAALERDECVVVSEVYSYLGETA